MKKASSLGLSVVLMLAGLVFTLRVSGVTPSEKQDAVLEGSVVSLDSASSPQVLDVKTADDKIVKVNLNGETTILKDGRVSALDQLASGQYVKVHSQAKDGKQVATSVTIVSTLSFPPSKEQHPAGSK